ncbi:hypothetical protein [Nostoc sp.]|uniref:hypothetical protein n=1 Tax=Nostoc sp. TaxID=1180 RepID=UPI002FFA479A
MRWRNRPLEAIAFAVFGVAVDESANCQRRQRFSSLREAAPTRRFADAIASFLKAQRQQLISYFISYIG